MLQIDITGWVKVNTGVVNVNYLLTTIQNAKAASFKVTV